MISIVDRAFYNKTNIVSVTIEDNNITAIGIEAFANCYSLINVIIEASVETRGNTAFYYNT